MKDSRKRSRRHDRAVKDAYNMLVTFRKLMEEKGNDEFAAEIENTYKNLWCECLNEKAPWT
jgi:hypothetical protein